MCLGTRLWARSACRKFVRELSEPGCVGMREAGPTGGIATALSQSPRSTGAEPPSVMWQIETICSFSPALGEQDTGCGLSQGRGHPLQQATSFGWAWGPQVVNGGLPAVDTSSWEIWWHATAATTMRVHVLSVSSSNRLLKINWLNIGPECFRYEHFHCLCVVSWRCPLFGLPSICQLSHLG